jgi:glycerophosphoryl diester phosphodiesterase
MRIPKLVGHRGYPRHYPENTLVGFEAAVTAGAHFVELDVQLTADQVPVVFHDRDLKRLCDADGRIHQFTAEQLQNFRATESGRFGYKFAQEPIPTLAEFALWLERHPKVTAFVEIKRISVQRFGNAVVLARMLRDLKPVLRRCVLISYSLETLAAARRQGWPALGVVIDDWADRRKPIVAEINPEYLFVDVNGLPRLGPLRFGNAKLAVYEVVDPHLALKLARRGVQLVETFAIGELRAALEMLAARA